MLLKDYLEQMNITYAQFAEEIGVSKGTVLRILKGFSPSLEVALTIELATKHNVNCEDLCALYPEIAKLFSSERIKNVMRKTKEKKLNPCNDAIKD